MKTWTPTDLSSEIESPFGPCVEPIIFTDDGQDFYLAVTPDRIAFGGVCNVGFIESGYIERGDGESLDKTLQELQSDLSVYYSDGPGYVSRIVCNERM